MLQNQEIIKEQIQDVNLNDNSVYNFLGILYKNHLRSNEKALKSFEKSNFYDTKNYYT